MTQSNIILTISGLSKEYRSGSDIVHALRTFDLQVKRGEFIALMGPSGSGKSTLLSLIAGLDRPTTGVVALGSARVTEMSETELAVLRSAKVGFIFQSFNLISSMTALENVELPARFSPRPNKNVRQRAIHLLETVGLGDRVHHLPSELSGGQQQRVAVARALINSPELIIGDEPTGNLDSETGQVVLELIHSVRSTENCAVIIATHDPSVAARADRVIVLRDGSILKEEISR